MEAYKAILITIALVFTLGFGVILSDKSKTEEVTILGKADSLSQTEQKAFENTFDDEVIVQTITKSGKRQKAVINKAQLREHSFPFKGNVGVYPDGFAFVR